jgi:hypothetical protein
MSRGSLSEKTGAIYDFLHNTKPGDFITVAMLTQKIPGFSWVEDQGKVRTALEKVRRDYDIIFSRRRANPRQGQQGGWVHEDEDGKVDLERVYHERMIKSAGRMKNLCATVDEKQLSQHHLHIHRVYETRANTYAHLGTDADVEQRILAAVVTQGKTLTGEELILALYYSTQKQHYRPSQPAAQPSFSASPEP